MTSSRYKSLVFCFQVRVQGSWTLVSRQTDSLEQKQPFVSTLTHFHIHALSHGPDRRQNRNKQVHSCHSQTLSIISNNLHAFKASLFPVLSNALLYFLSIQISSLIHSSQLVPSNSVDFQTLATLSLGCTSFLIVVNI